MTRHATVRTKAGRLKLAITAHAGTKHVAHLRKHLTAAWPMIKHAPSDVSVALVGDDHMARLHKHFLKIDGPTDVLTFELDHNNAGRCIGGEVIVCVPEAERRAAEMKLDPANELLLYALHGLLHLSGFDDRTPADYEAMHQREDEILTALKIGKLFHRPRTASKRGRTRS